MAKLKILVLFSGGLDSLATVKLLQEQDLDIETVYFKLPFGGGCGNKIDQIIKFNQENNIKLHMIDLTKGKLFQDYLKIIKNPIYGTGTAINPCKDCKIFMLKEAKKLAEKINAEIVATGEVVGQRPMSQLIPALKLSEEKSGLQGKLLRPLSAKLLPETDAEKEGKIDRTKLLGIQGRRRTEQINLAKKYNFEYPNSGGGCLLCEKDCAAKLSDLFSHKTDIKIEEVKLINIGRHFRKNKKIILGRTDNENKLLELYNKKMKYNIQIPKTPGPTILYEDTKDEPFVKKLFKAYTKGGTQKDKDYVEKYKI